MSRFSVLIRTVLALVAWTSITIVSQAQTTNQPPRTNEVFRLKNGDRLSGFVVKEDEKSLHLSTPWNGDVLLPKTEIENREVQRPVAETAKALPVPTVIDPLPKPADPAPKKPAGVWKANVQLGADLRESTVSSYLYSAVAKVTYAYDRWHNSADWRYSYGKSGNTLSADRMDGTIKTDLDLGPKKEWFLYALGGAGYDEVRKIDYQYEFGPGVGRHVLTRTNMTLNVEGGFTYQEQNFSNSKSRNEFRLRFAEDYFWRVSSKVKLEQKGEIQPAFDEPGDYRIRLELGVSYALFNNVSWNVTVINLYDSKPAAGVSNNDLQIRSGVGLSF